MNHTTPSQYRVWDPGEKTYHYYDELPDGVDEANVSRNTLLKETGYSDRKEAHRYIYEGDQVNIRDIEERFNCGGDNTIDNTGTVVWKDDQWQLHCTLDSDFSYMHDNDYYILLDQPGTRRKIV